jgi:uncharacterized membrane protein YdbT with pleckstrin-like domain
MNEIQHYTSHPAVRRGNPAVFVFCLLLVPVGIGIIALFFWWLWCRCATLTITDERVTLRTGILTTKLSEVLHRDIRNVQITQSLLQRLTNAGKIGISSAGQAGIEIEIDGIVDPNAVKAIIDRCRGT